MVLILDSRMPFNHLHADADSTAEGVACPIAQCGQGICDSSADSKQQSIFEHDRLFNRWDPVGVPCNASISPCHQQQQHLFKRNNGVSCGQVDGEKDHNNLQGSIDEIKNVRRRSTIIEVFPTFPSDLTNELDSDLSITVHDCNGNVNHTLSSILLHSWRNIPGDLTKQDPSLLFPMNTVALLCFLDCNYW